jgi:putative endonuclease
MSEDPRRSRGQLGERLAEQHLLEAGYLVLERNFRTRYGELDLVARRPEALVFCEVKTLVAGSAAGPPSPLEAIGPAKRRQVRQMAAQWLATRARAERPLGTSLRFDAIGVTLSRAGEVIGLEHLENAF